MTHLRTLIWCQPTLSSPGASDIVHLFPVLTCMAEWKGPGIVFTTGSPQVPSQQYGGRHGSQRAQRVSSSLTDLTKWYEFLRGKSNRGFGKSPYSFFGKDFRRQHRLEWEREHGLKRRGSSKLAISLRLWSGCDSCWRRRPMVVDFMISQDEVSCLKTYLALPSLRILLSGFYFKNRIPGPLGRPGSMFIRNFSSCVGRKETQREGAARMCCQTVSDPSPVGI